MINVAVAQQHQVSFFDVRRLETQRREHAAAIKIGIEQNDLAVVHQFKIGKARPAYRQHVRIFGECAAGGYQRGAVARGIGGLHRDGRVHVLHAPAIQTRIGQRARHRDTAAKHYNS